MTLVKKPKHVAGYRKQKSNLFSNETVLTEWASTFD
jgi:hypothetical protein